MGGRYYFTGVQLGMLAFFITFNKQDDAMKLIKQIQDKQFLGEIKNGQEMKIVTTMETTGETKGDA
jgi:hypothetical protein